MYSVISQKAVAFFAVSTQGAWKDAVLCDAIGIGQPKSNISFCLQKNKLQETLFGRKSQGILGHCLQETRRKGKNS